MSGILYPKLFTGAKEENDEIRKKRLIWQIGFIVSCMLGVLGSFFVEVWFLQEKPLNWIHVGASFFWVYLFLIISIKILLTPITLT